MKSFSFSPIIPALLAASVLTGCAGGMANHHTMMSDGGCSCCGMRKAGMSNDMKLGQSSPQKGAMCMPSKDGADKSGCGCCDMGKMGAGGCNCCGVGKQ